MDNNSQEVILNKEDRHNIFQYFFLIDVELSADSQPEEHPTILSSYSIEGNSKSFARLRDMILNDNTIRNMIFPPMITKFEIEKTTLFYQFKEPQRFYTDYIKHEQSLPVPLFHCCLVKDWKEIDNEWYFNCLIIWEQYMNGHKGKAMLFVTHEALFTLSKTILIELYYKCINSQDIPIEPYIINIMHKIKSKPNSNTSIVFMPDKVITTSKMIQPYLKQCDLNYRLFFNYFSFEDVLYLAEQFFLMQNIIISSPQLNILYPIYHIFISLIQPLGSTDNSYIFRFLTDEATPVLCGPISFFIFAYAEVLPITFIHSLVNIKEANITVITINKENQMSKLIYEYKGKNKNVTLQPFPTKSLIQTVMSYELSEELYYNLINSKLEGYKNTYKPEHKSFFEYTHKDNEIRILFFSLFTKFYASFMPQLSFDLKYNQINYSIDYKANKQQKKLSKALKDVSSSAAFQSLYQINLPLDHPDLYYHVLLDELIKVIKADDKRLYFEFITKNQLENETETETERIVIVNEAELNEKMQRYKQLESVVDTFHFTDEGKLIYDQMHFYFEAIKNKKANNNKANQVPYNIFMIDLKVFMSLSQGGILVINDPNELVGGLSALVLSIIILNEIENDLVEIKIIYQLIDTLFDLCYNTKGFYSKFNFLITLMFEIIISNSELYNKYNEQYFKLLQSLQLVPPFIVYLQYNELFSNNKLIKNTMRKPKTKFLFPSFKELNLENNKLNLNYEKEMVLREFVLNGNYMLKYLVNFILQNKGVFVENINALYDNWALDIMQISYLYYQYFHKSLFSLSNP